MFQYVAASFSNHQIRFFLVSMILRLFCVNRICRNSNKPDGDTQNAQRVEIRISVFNDQLTSANIVVGSSDEILFVTNSHSSAILTCPHAEKMRHTKESHEK